MAGGEVALRKLTVADSARVMEWRQRNAGFFTGPPPRTLADQYRWHLEYLADPWDHMYAVLHDGKPAGTIGVALHEGTAEIQRLLLGAKDLGRSGIMTGALAALTAAYGERAYTLRVLRANTAAISFYGRNGFTVTGAEGDCLVMTR